MSSNENNNDFHNTMNNANDAQMRADETPTAAQPPLDAQSAKPFAYDFAQRPQTPMYTANPVPPRNGGDATAAVRVHDKLSGKMMAFVIGISLACGLGAGVAGSAIANALSGSAHPGHTMPFAQRTDEDIEQLMPGGGSRGDIGNSGEDMGGRGGMQDFGGGRGMRGGPQGHGGDAESDGDGASGDANKCDGNGKSAQSDKSTDSGSANESGYYWYSDLLGL